MAYESSLSSREVIGRPHEFYLDSNFPNPFNSSTRLHLTLPEAIHVKITVYDVMGREVVRLVDNHLNAGSHQIIWDGRDRIGRELFSGLYIARLVTPEFAQSIKMVLLK